MFSLCRFVVAEAVSLAVGFYCVFGYVKDFGYLVIAVSVGAQLSYTLFLK